MTNIKIHSISHMLIFTYTQKIITSNNFLFYCTICSDLYCLCGIYSTIISHSIKQCVGDDMNFNFKHDGTLFHHVVSGGIISMHKSKDDILLI